MHVLARLAHPKVSNDLPVGDDGEALLHRFYEPIWAGDERVGFVTSAVYGHTCHRSLVVGYMASKAAMVRRPLDGTTVGGAPRLPNIGRTARGSDGRADTGVRFSSPNDMD